MEEIKKLLVLVTSIILIGLVIYFVSISSFQKSGKPTAEDTLLTQMPDQELEAEDSTEARQSIAKEDTGEANMEGIKKEIQKDSVKWHQLGKGSRQVQRKGESIELPVRINKLFVEAARRILPAVVSIRSTQVFKFLPEDHPEFYPRGSGSGVIISDDGYILTNFHVINEAKDLQIILYDKREFSAEYIGGDPTTDVALLKIKAEDLPVAYMGTSDSIEVGEWVLAVGNPLDFRSTITAGIISALGRDINIIDEEYRIENFIQTDAVINPGNSGGALVNLNGEVIGINTAIATRTGFNQGYGFAIPINLAKKVVDDIALFGYVKRGLLGISIGRVSSSAARATGLAKPKGVLVEGVRQGYPAQAIGLKQGDIILAVNDEDVNAPNELQMKIARKHPGAKVNLTVWRDGAKKRFEVTLAEAPVSNTKSLLSLSDDELEYENLGLTVRELTRDEKTYMDNSEGVLVENVYAGSPAQNAGIFRADVIIRIDEEEIKSKADFEKRVENASSGEVLKFQIIRKFENQDIYNRIVFVEVP